MVNSVRWGDVRPSHPTHPRAGEQARLIRARQQCPERLPRSLNQALAGKLPDPPGDQHLQSSVPWAKAPAVETTTRRDIGTTRRAIRPWHAEAPLTNVTE